MRAVKIAAAAIVSAAAVAVMIYAVYLSVWSMAIIRAALMR
jgi:hypothetical protein